MKRRTIRLAATSARIATGAAVAGACVLGVVAAVAAPWPGVQTTGASTTVAPVPGDTTLVCNGSFRALGRDASQADLLVSAAAPRLQLDTGDAETEAAPLQMPGVLGAVGAQSVTGAVVDRRAPLISAVESVAISADDLRGLAAAPCRETSLRSWLVGGDGATGSSDVILLSNPADVPTTVDFVVYGAQRSTTTRVLPPQTQMSLPLASVAGAEPRPVIEVIATGAPVRATLQSSHVRTLEAVGIDLQDGLGSPRQSLRMLGVRSQPIDEGDDATGIVVRLLSPADHTRAIVRVRGASGVTGDEYAVELPAGVPAEISLSGVAAGAYDVEVDADAPVVAAARQTVRAGGEEDFAWMLPAPRLSGTVAFSVPGGQPAHLFVRNGEEAPVTVTLEGADARRIDLPPGATKTVPLRAGAHRLGTGGTVHAAVGLFGDAAMAGWPLWAPPATQRPITVRP